MAHETLVRRTDVESAFGPVGPIDRDVATDGVDEVLTAWLGYRLVAQVLPETPPDRRYHGSGQVVGVAAGTRVWRGGVGGASAGVAPPAPPARAAARRRGP